VWLFWRMRKPGWIYRWSKDHFDKTDVAEAAGNFTPSCERKAAMVMFLLINFKHPYMFVFQFLFLCEEQTDNLLFPWAT